LDTQVFGGWIYEPISRFAKTTTERHYFIAEKIPYHTIDDIKQEKEDYIYGLKHGHHGTYYEQFWSKTKNQILDGAKNYAQSFLPTPLDPVYPDVAEFNKRSRMPWFHEIQKGQRGRILQEDYADEGEPASTETDPTSAENKIGIDEEAEDDDPFKDISYPAPILAPKFIQYGGFLLYLMGKFLFFLNLTKIIIFSF